MRGIGCGAATEVALEEVSTRRRHGSSIRGETARRNGTNKWR